MLVNQVIYDAATGETRIEQVEVIEPPQEPSTPPTPTLEEKVEAIGKVTHVHDMDINELIVPYCLDLDHQVTQINLLLGSIAPQNKIKTVLGGMDMTYKVLKRQIINQQLELKQALQMITDFKADNKLNAAEVEELTVLAHTYLV